MKGTLFILIALFSCVAVHAQQKNTDVLHWDTLKIAFTERIIPQQVDLHRSDALKWELRNAKDNILVASDQQGSLFDYQFNNPGEYVLFIQQSDNDPHQGCGHAHPSANWLLNISNTHISFKLDEMVFSQPLIGNTEASNIILSVPVTIKHADNQKLASLTSRVIGQGINCSLQGDLLNPETLMEKGDHVLRYRLKGMAQKDTYIMFDFIDHNGQIQTYYYPEKL